MASLSEASQRRLAKLVSVLSRPVVALAALIMRTPLAPCVLLVLRLLRSCIRQVFRLVHFGGYLTTATCNCCRRRLIVALGGSISDAFEIDSHRFD